MKRTNWRFYKSRADRRRAVTQLKRRYNYLVGWLDVAGFGLHFTNAEWVLPGQKYINLSDR